MVVKTIEIEVIDGEVTQATKNVDKLDDSLKKTEKTADKASDGIGDSLDGAGESANNLKGGVEGVAAEFVNVGKAAKKGGAAMRTALISTGVGALVVALGFVVDNWESIKNFVLGINDDLKVQTDIINSQLDVIDSRKKLLEAEKKLLIEQGDSLEQIKERQKDTLLIERQQLINKAKLLATDLRRLKATIDILRITEKETGVKFINDEEIEKLKQLEIDLNNINAQIIDNQTLLLGLNEEDRPRRTTSSNTNTRENLNALDVDEFGIADPFNEQKERDAKRAEALREGTEELVEVQNERLDAELAQLEASAAIDVKRTEDERKQSEAREEIARQEAEAKKLLLFGVADSLQAVSEIAGRETGAGKALAVASSLINTYSAIAGQLKAFAGVPIPGYAIAQAIATGAAGFAAVKNILKVKVPNDRSSSSGSFSTSGGAQAPSFNVVGTSGVNQLAQSLNNSNEPIRAFVVSSDVTSQQEFDRNVEDNSSI